MGLRELLLTILIGLFSIYCNYAYNIELKLNHMTKASRRLNRLRSSVADGSVQVAFLTFKWLRRWTADSRCKMNKGGEREGGALKAAEAACMDAPCSPA